MGSNAVYDKSRFGITKVVELLKSHPNYKDPVPIPGESKIQFALRAAAHLVSPPHIAGEDNEIECTDMADAILAIGPELEKIWEHYQKA